MVLVWGQPTQAVGYGYRTIRFQGHKPPADLKLEVLQPILAGFIEHGQPLKMPPAADIPRILGRPFTLAAKHFTGHLDQLARLQKHRDFGISEETGDVLYYMVIKAAMDKGVLNQSRFDAFHQATEPSRQITDPTLRIARIFKHARAAVTQTDLDQVRPYFNRHKSSQTDELLRNLLASFLLDYGLGVADKRKGITMTDSQAFMEKMKGEIAELAEHYAARGFNTQTLTTMPDRLNTPQGNRAAIKTLITMAKTTLKSPDMQFDNLMRFTTIKSLGRSEYMATHPQLPYAEAKHHAKAWEKLLEGYFLLRHL